MPTTIHARLLFSWLATASLSAALAFGAPRAAAEPSGSAAEVSASDGAAPAAVGRTVGKPNSKVEIGAQAQPAPEPGVAEAPPAIPAIPACTSDPAVLGLSRVVEIDAAGGPEFGGKEDRRHDFLNDREVVLTFDDGPMRSHTRTVLAALAAQCTRATFFMIGRMAAADPAMVREVMAQGHTIGSHTWSHKNMRTVGKAVAEKDFEMGISAVSRAAGGASAPFFRFPYLSEGRAILDHAAKRNIATFWIDVDSKDYLTRSSQEVQRRIMAQLNAKGKGVILMHDIQSSSVGAIAPLLDELRRRGYKVVHVTPKAPASTVAGADAAVAKAFGDKAKALAENPLADRSVVWAADPGSAAQPKRAAANRKGSKQTTAAPVEDFLPWLQPSPPPAPPPNPSARKKPAPQVSGDPSWQPFSY